jgi:uncharacterized protein (TIRG00374 family)
MQGWDFDWSAFFSTLWTVHPGWLTASVAATLLGYVFRAFRWQVLLEPLRSIRIRPLLVSTLVGFSAIYVFGRAGELVRPIWLTRREKIPMTASVATIVVERFLDSLMLIAFFAWSLIFIDLAATAGDATYAIALMKKAAGVMAFGTTAAIVFMFLFRANIERVVQYVPFARVRSLARGFAEGLSSLQRGQSLVLAVVHSFILWLLIGLQFWFLLLAMNFNFSIQAATLVLVAAAIGSIAQVPGIGGGFQAGFIFCMTTFFAVPAEQAIVRADNCNRGIVHDRAGLTIERPSGGGRKQNIVNL